MLTKWVTLFVIMPLIMACATRQPVQMQTKFDTEEHKPYTETGNNTIKGQAFLRQRGGGIVTCAGSDVMLVPATSFFREAINLFRAGKKPLSNIDPTYSNMIKRSQGDAQGNFSFRNLPNGNWYVLPEVKWTVGYNPQGGTLMKEVSVSNGETKQVLLTDRDLIER
jgi:hypothetical protein